MLRRLECWLAGHPHGVGGSTACLPLSAPLCTCTLAAQGGRRHCSAFPPQCPVPCGCYTRGRLDGHNQAVDDIVVLDTPAFIDTAYPNGWLQLWLEGTPAKSLVGTEQRSSSTRSSTSLHISALYGTGRWYHQARTGPDHMHHQSHHCLLLPLLFLLFLTSAAALLEAAFLLMAPLPGFLHTHCETLPHPALLRVSLNTNDNLNIYISKEFLCSGTVSEFKLTVIWRLRNL